MSEPNSNQENGGSGAATISNAGDSGGNFSIGDFIQAAGTAPPVENPQYEPDTRSGNESQPDQPATANVDGEGNPPPSGQAPKAAQTTPSPQRRTLQEIQAHRSAQAKARVFEGLTEEEIPIFKEMSQRAYEKLYPAYLAQKQAEAKITELTKAAEEAGNRRWYEEDGAYQLHPDYREISQYVENLETEEAFWQEQLAKAEAGQRFNLLARDPKTNQYIVGDVQEPSPQGKALIISNISKLAQFKSNAATERDRLQSTFTSRYKAHSDSLKAVDKEMFGTLDMEKNPAVKQYYEAALAKIPAEFRGQLIYQMVAKSAAVIQGLVAALRANDANGAKQRSIAATVRQAGPGNGLATGGGSKDGKDYDKFFEGATRRSLH